MQIINRKNEKVGFLKISFILFLMLFNLSFISAVDFVGCQENLLATPYTGGSVESMFNNVNMIFNSRCTDLPEKNLKFLTFYYCNGNLPVSYVYFCECDGNQCIADSSDAFTWIGSYEENHNPHQIVDDNFIYSVMKNWIEN